MRIVAATLASLLIAVPQLTAAAHKCVTVRVTPCVYAARPVLMAPVGTTLCAEVRVEPHPDHRFVEVLWESESGQVGEASQTLEGDSDPLLVRAPGFKQTFSEGGNYQVLVKVCTTRPVRDERCRPVHGSATARLRIIAPFDPTTEGVSQRTPRRPSLTSLLVVSTVLHEQWQGILP